MRCRLAFCLLCWAALVWSAEPTPETARGQRLLDAYFRHQVKQVADSTLTDLTARDWEKKRPELRRQFLDMMGLWPLPPRGDLHATVTGKVDAGAFTIEKLHFQSVPGLYVTANLYVPKDLKSPAPAVLYVCGHANTVVDKVSFGSKANYQHHPAWFAEHGYVSLILDTLQLGEIEGIHHGTHPRFNHNFWWWQTVGYTPAGVECWNAMRALDYLETRKEVDPKRLGVTGRSGGGATSWWLAAADDRVQCVVPVAGIADLQAHVVEGVAPRYKDGVISGHCDCMYFVNTYRWDFPQVAALCAPRPLLLGNSDADDIFPAPGYRRLAEKVRKVYELYGAGDKFAVLETAGPHKDTPELRLGAYRWFERWLKHGGKQPAAGQEVTEQERPRLPPEQLKVFERLPGDAINATVHETFIRPASTELPRVPEVAREWWKGKREEWLQALQERVFAGWPKTPPELDAKPAADVRHDGLRLRAIDFTSEQEVELRVWLLTADKVEKPQRLTVHVVDEPAWQDWTAELGPAFKEALLLSKAPSLDPARFRQDRETLEFHRRAFAVVAPRGIGPTRWAAAGTPEDSHIRRRFALLGQTLDGQRVWDVRRALEALRGVPDLKDVPVELRGKGDLAGVTLYAALFEPQVAGLDLWGLPASHRQGPIFLNVRRLLDTPQAVALAFPRPVRLHVQEERDAESWQWPLQLQKALGRDYLTIRTAGE
jgi:dienelactone hydrolase